MTRRWLAALFPVVAVAVLVGACKAKVGDKCSGGAATCTDKTSALFCIDDTYTAITCRGDKGCAQNGSVVDCDESIANEQDPCNAPDAIACSADHKEALRCTNKHFVLDETCKGPTGCKVDVTQKISCDNDIADVNDPCHFLGDYACTTDRSLVLRCDANKMTPLNSCRGPKQCHIVNVPKQEKVEFLCDDSVAEEGDACDTNGEEACSMDKMGMFVCKGNKFGSLRPCGGGCLYDEKTDRYTCADASNGPPPDAPLPPSPQKHRGHH
jgi:hypothetical protein